ncbi:MAG: urate hydroxylase PuuD [Deltaproteobacteria bacterium]|nr:MAG: urate hydroxylase PuuD [Deltaproteobacteria bacterium]TMB14683.1 MAG: urate hydroxylase PuuD [Deltaproteobacteria bacterium]
MPALEALFRWIHIVAGIVWIGHLYFFNFVNGPFAGTMDPDTRKKVVPQLMPRALYWFRWGAAWTWVTGVLLVLLIFYHGREVFPGIRGFALPDIVMILVTFLAFLGYDALWKSGLGKDIRVGAALCYGLVVVIVLLYVYWAGFSYRGYVIHTGALFGTIMAANVWMRIWPMQRRIITAVKEGTAPDPAWAALAGARSRHNVYMSVPLVWTMISSHTTTPFASSPVYLLVVILVGWGAVYLLYKKAPKVPGF